MLEGHLSDKALNPLEPKLVVEADDELKTYFPLLWTTGIRSFLDLRNHLREGEVCLRELLDIVFIVSELFNDCVEDLKARNHVLD